MFRALASLLEASGGLCEVSESLSETSESLFKPSKEPPEGNGVEIREKTCESGL